MYEHGGFRSGSMFHSGPFKICRRLAQGAQTRFDPILAETVTQQKHLYTRFTLYTNNVRVVLVRSDLIEAVYRRAADMLLLV